MSRPSTSLIKVQQDVDARHDAGHDEIDAPRARRDLAMRVLVTSGYGLIGSACLARLHRDGHELVAAGRTIEEARRRAPFARWIAADFNRLTQREDWAPLLAGIEAVVNCVGVLQDGARDDVRRVQVAATVALFAACERAGARRVIHISAI